jgi:hypothetical protein
MIPEKRIRRKTSIIRRTSGKRWLNVDENETDKKFHSVPPIHVLFFFAPNHAARAIWLRKSWPSHAHDDTNLSSFSHWLPQSPREGVVLSVPQFQHPSLPPTRQVAQRAGRTKNKRKHETNEWTTNFLVQERERTKRKTWFNETEKGSRSEQTTAHRVSVELPEKRRPSITRIKSELKNAHGHGWCEHGNTSY